MNVCPTLKVPCPHPKRPTLISFWAGLFIGADANASMAKTLMWVLTLAFIISWFVQPGIVHGELLGFIIAVLGYILGGKWSWRKYGGPE